MLLVQNMSVTLYTYLTDLYFQKTYFSSLCMCAIKKKGDNGRVRWIIQLQKSAEKLGNHPDGSTKRSYKGLVIQTRRDREQTGSILWSFPREWWLGVVAGFAEKSLVPVTRPHSGKKEKRKSQTSFRKEQFNRAPRAAGLRGDKRRTWCTHWAFSVICSPRKFSRPNIVHQGTKQPGKTNDHESFMEAICANPGNPHLLNAACP